MTDAYLCSHCGEVRASTDGAACAECAAPVECVTCGLKFPRYAVYVGIRGAECGGCEDKAIAALDAHEVAVGRSEGRVAYLLSQGVTRS